MRGFRRTKPRISFALATLFIVLLLFLLSGGAELTLRLERIAEHPEDFAGGRHLRLHGGSALVRVVSTGR